MTLADKSPGLHGVELSGSAECCQWGTREVRAGAASQSEGSSQPGRTPTYSSDTAGDVEAASDK